MNKMLVSYLDRDGRLVRYRRKPRSNVFNLGIRQGMLLVVANNSDHADRQARVFEQDCRMQQVRRQAEAEPGVFCLGAEAWDRYRERGLQ